MTTNTARSVVDQRKGVDERDEQRDKTPTGGRHVSGWVSLLNRTTVCPLRP